MKCLVKICGITNLKDAVASIESGADAIGFIFYKKSKRCVSPAIVADIIKNIPSNIFKVGVFVNESASNINTIVEQTGINIVQLHGDEKPEDCSLSKLCVWKGVRLKDETEIKQLSLFTQFSVRAFVFDSHFNGEYGGTGVLSDWNLAKLAASKYRIILSGGLNPDNIQAAINTVQPYGVDVNSGVEALPGKKDLFKIKTFINAVYVSSNEN